MDTTKYNLVLGGGDKFYFGGLYKLYDNTILHFKKFKN